MNDLWNIQFFSDVSERWETYWWNDGELGKSYEEILEELFLFKKHCESQMNRPFLYRIIHVATGEVIPYEML